MAVEELAAWDYAAVADRIGQGARGPVAGETITVPLDVRPSRGVGDVAIIRAEINGQDVLHTATAAATVVFDLLFFFLSLAKAPTYRHFFFQNNFSCL